MRLTTKTDYCIRVLIYLQTKPGRVKIQTIADTHEISKNHLSVAVNKLSGLGYIISTKGPKGGIEFNPKAKKKKLGDLISQLEELNIVECFDINNNSCSLTSHCRLKKVLKSAARAFTTELNTHTVEDLV